MSKTPSRSSGDIRSGMERAMAEQADALHGQVARPKQPRASLGVNPETSMVQERRGSGSKPKVS